MDEGLRAFGAAMAALEDELDWGGLGNAYCQGDGSGFFDAALRERILETGYALADEIARRLDGSRGASLYLGADVAELPLILAEHLVLGRKVEWLNLDCPPQRELVRALRVVAARLCLELPVPAARALEDVGAGCCDHIWMVSVLTDPDHFPALHDLLYERRGSALATGRGSLADERSRAEKLIHAWLDRAGPDCVLSTTDEEQSLIEPLVSRRGATLEFGAGGWLSAVVGDVIRIGVIRGGRSARSLPGVPGGRAQAAQEDGTS